MNRFCLGTAQLGMKYGIANHTGKPSRDLAISIIHEAISCGVTSIDTARAYGESEAIIGEAIQENLKSKINVITKISLSRKCNNSSSKQSIKHIIRENIFKSCKFLKTSHLETLLIHDWNYRHDYEKGAWEEILDLKEQGVIKSIGVSIYEPCEAFDAMQNINITHIQLPFNILDWRWKSENIENVKQKKSDILIYARSVFLQGLLISDISTWQKIKNIDEFRLIKKLDELVREFERESRKDLCLAYVRSQNWIDKIIMGVETRLQLKENIKLFQNPLLTQEQCQIIEEKIGNINVGILNPGKWKINA